MYEIKVTKEFPNRIFSAEEFLNEALRPAYYLKKPERIHINFKGYDANSYGFLLRALELFSEELKEDDHLIFTWVLYKKRNGEWYKSRETCCPVKKDICGF